MSPPQEPALTTTCHPNVLPVPVLLTALTTTWCYVSVVHFILLPPHQNGRPQVKDFACLFSAVSPTFSTIPGTRQALRKHVLDESVGIGASGCCCTHLSGSQGLGDPSGPQCLFPKHICVPPNLSPSVTFNVQTSTTHRPTNSTCDLVTSFVTQDALSIPNDLSIFHESRRRTHTMNINRNPIKGDAQSAAGRVCA